MGVRKRTQVTTRSMRLVSCSPWVVIHLPIAPATIQGASCAVSGRPPDTCEKTIHEATNEPASAGTAIQCAPRPVMGRERMVRRAPASGNAGISQTALDTGPIYRGARGGSRKPPTAARLLCVAGKQELRLVEGLGSHLAEAALLVEAPQGLVQRRLVGIAGQRGTLLP